MMMMASNNWEALPPRGEETSSSSSLRGGGGGGGGRQERRRRRREAPPPELTQLRAPQVQEATSAPPSKPQQTQPKRKPNRPGFNSYLKVILDDRTMDRLHNVAKRIQTKVQKFAKEANKEEEREEKDAVSGTENRPLEDVDKKDVAAAADVVVESKAAEDSKEDNNDTATPATTTEATKDGEPNSNTADSSDPNQPAGANKGKEGKKKNNRNKKPRPPSFKPRSRASLHMTFFFGGEALCELPPNELQDWYDQIRDRLSVANFILSSASTATEEETTNVAAATTGTTTTTTTTEEETRKGEEKDGEQEAGDATTNKPVSDVDNHPVYDGNDDASHDDDVLDDYWFDVTDVRLFPPGRNNLIVAHLEAAPAWHELHNDIRTIAKTAESEGLNEVTAYSKEKWTAHITMGNIFGGGTKAQIRNTFTAILQEVMNELKEERRRKIIATESSLATEERNDDDQQQEMKDDNPKSSSSPSSCDDDDEKYLFKARTHGIGMGGPIPEQVEGLDWNFTYTPPTKQQ